MLANRLRKNQRHLKNWLKRENIYCYRLYDADMPEFAFAIDLYQGHRLGESNTQSQRWAHVQEYEAPKTVDPDKVLARRKLALATIAEVLALDADHLVFKMRRQQKGDAQYEKLSNAKQMIQTQEGGLAFLVNLHDYLDTGLFLDHRTTRDMIRQQASGCRFLNLFAYTGSVSVYAADGGATSTTTVDMSNTYLTWAKQNMGLNKLTQPCHEFVQADVLQWLAQCKQEYDLIFLDPPSYSSSKRMTSTFDVQRDQLQLLELTLTHLSENGVLVFSNNRRGFKLDDSLAKRYRVNDISTQTIPKDFERNKKIHQCWLIKKRT